MSANDNFSLHDDEELSLHDDASLNGSEPVSNKGDAPAKPPQIITFIYTFKQSNCPSFKKMIIDSGRWSEHYLEIISDVFSGMADAKDIMGSYQDKIRSLQEGQVRGQSGMERMHVALIKGKVECFNCHNTGPLLGVQVLKIQNVEAGREASRGQISSQVNKANMFTPRPVQLSNIRPNISTASITIKTGRVNVNTGKQNVSSGNKHVNSGTQFKSGASRFNTGKQHVNSGSVNVNSGTQFKSGASKVNTGNQNVNTARVNRPFLSNQTSQVNLRSPKKCFSKQSSPVNRPFSRNTAYKSNIYAVKGNMGTAVKTSAGQPLTAYGSHRGIFDSGCSGHMTGNRAHLEDYQELSKVGSVTFGGSKGSISGKGSKEVIDIDVQTEEAEELLVVSSTSRKAAGSEHNATKKSHSSKKPSSTQYHHHLGPVPTKTPTSTNPVNTGGGNVHTGNEQVSPGHIEAVSPSAHNVEEVFSDDDDDEMPEIRQCHNQPHSKDSHASSSKSNPWSPITPVQTRSSLQEITDAHALSEKLLKCGSWVEAMQEGTCTKWVYRNKKDEMRSSCRKKATASGSRSLTEEGLTMMRFLPVARIEVIRSTLSRTRRHLISQKVTPKTSHLNAVKRIFKYLKGKPNLGLWYPRDSPLDLEAFSVVNLVLFGVEKSEARSTWAWKRKCQVSLANWMQFGLGFLFKPAESAGYTEIVDFLRISKLRYALTHNPPIYDSLVKQFWQTATARTLADGTGPSFDPSYHMPPPPLHEPEIQTSRSSEESEQLRNLLDLVPRLESRVESLEEELNDTKQTLGTAVLKLIKKVKKLEHKFEAKRKIRKLEDDKEKRVQD
ncbi:hypothetical protein Tco_1204456 [Tanacetum coccineum]